MSTAARDEAIEIVMDELIRQSRRGLAPGEQAEQIVDKLLETHAISRQAPRILRRSDDSHPAAQVARAGQKPTARTAV